MSTINQKTNTMKIVSIIIGLLVLPIIVYNEKSIEINGTIVDGIDQTPLKDCHVYVKNTHIGVVSDALGRFSIEVPLLYKNRPLVVSYVGYATYEEKVSKIHQQEVQILLQPSGIALDEVVVMPGKELLVDQAIDSVLVEYDDREEMLMDFYLALLVLDEGHSVWEKVNDSLTTDE